MRCIWIAMSLALAAVSVCSAQHHRRHTARPCQPTCEAPPSAPQAPEQPEQPQAPQQPVYAAPQGMFMQPPASGTVYGPVEQDNVEGPALTFHGITLRFPTLRMPTWSRSRTNARMEIDSASAPFVPGYPPTGAFAAVAMAPQAPPQQDAPQAPNAPEDDEPVRAPPNVPSCPRTPSCEAQALMQLEVLERQRLQLESELLAIKQMLHQDGGARTAPNSDPVAAPPGGQTVQYFERPANYICEPQRLPQRAPVQNARPISEPTMQPAGSQHDWPSAGNVIREPRPIQSRITNVRLSR